MVDGVFELLELALAPVHFVKVFFLDAERDVLLHTVLAGGLKTGGSRSAVIVHEYRGDWVLGNRLGVASLF